MFASCKQKELVISSSDIKTLALSKKLIEVDSKYFNDPDFMGDSKKIPLAELKKIRAILYRIYSNVEVENNQYNLKIYKGADIHITEEIFSIYKKDLEEMNAYIVEHNKQVAAGNAVDTVYIDIPAISDEYLNSLLQIDKKE